MQIQEQNEIRKQRGMEIAQTCRILHREKGGYVVPSQSGQTAYIVQYKNYKPICECPDFEMRGIQGIKCKHIWAVEVTINKEQNADGSTTITKTVKMTYPQDWSAYDQAKTQEKGIFFELLHDLCGSIENPEYAFGRPKMPLSDMIFASALKVYSTFSLRRFISDIKTAKEKGYVDIVPCYASVGHFIQKEDLTPILIDLIIKSSMPLKSVETDFAIDSSGFGTSRFARWYSFKYGREQHNKIWIKAHLVCGVKTNIVTAIKLGESTSADSPQFAELITKTSENFKISEISADKAYSSRDNMSIVNTLGGEAYIPFKSNTTGKSRGSKLWARMFHYFMFQREEFLQHYHKRSNVETTFHMIKSKFGDSIRSKTKTAQINEVLLKVLCHNICVVIQEMHELGIEPNFFIEK